MREVSVRGFAAGVACLVLVVLALEGASRADLPTETVGRVEVLPEPARPHWAFVADVLLGRSALVDLDDGSFLGMLSTGFLSPTAIFPRSRAEFYLPETYYSRGSRGERADVVTIYETGSLAPVAEVVIPPKRAINVLATANAALSDDDRFLAVFNMTPATSLSVVDVEARRFVEEITTAGCSLAYAAGPRRFLMLCADGSFLTVTLDDAGRKAAMERSEPFFDPETDPVIEKAARYRDTWLFVSFEGRVHPIDVSGEAPQVGEAWSLVTDAERADDWRTGGTQPFAVHEATNRFFVLMHQGGPQTHKDPGTELWVYDLEKRERVERLELAHPGLSFLSETIELPGWPGLWSWILDTLVPHPGINNVQVTQDDAPLLVTGAQIGGSVAVYDATSYELLRRVPSGNFTVHVLQAPWGGGGR